MAILRPSETLNAPSFADNRTLFGFVPRVFVLGGLPHSRPVENRFYRSFGSFRLSLFAPEDIGLPYGRIPRLILSHITTLAVRGRTPELFLARSFRSFCEVLGMPATGGPNGYLARVREQLIRVANLGVKATWDAAPRAPMDPDESRIYVDYSYPISTTQVFLPPGRRSASPVYLRLSDEAFQLVSHKPVPVSVATLKQLQSPMAMDIYMYCTWRAIRALRRGRPEPVPWLHLQQQLGSDYGRLRDFRSRFVAHLKTVIRHYPEIRVEATTDSLIVHPYKPHIPRRAAADF